MFVTNGHNIAKFSRCIITNTKIKSDILEFIGPGSGRYIVAGGSGANEAKVFDHKNGNTVVGKTSKILFLFLTQLIFLTVKLAVGDDDVVQYAKLIFTITFFFIFLQCFPP